MFPAADDDPSDSRARVAAVLRTRRMTAGLTQRQLAGLAGVGVRTLRELERARVNRPQRGTLELLADALDLTGQARETFTGGQVVGARMPRRGSARGASGRSGADSGADHAKTLQEMPELRLAQHPGEPCVDQLEVSG